jgi:prepilin-type N-terminal cleavage/methylation domain-containing protein
MNRFKGFNLIEVMIAVVVIMVGIFPVYYLMTSGTRGVSVSMGEILAVNHASSVMELLKGLSYQKLLSFCEGGEMTAAQVGSWRFNNETKNMEKVEEGGGWAVETGSSAANGFFTEWDQKELLPPMEKKYKRTVTLKCVNEGAKYCYVNVMMEWQAMISNSKGSGNMRSLDIRTVVVAVN